MSLFADRMEPCRKVERKRVPDGEGGFTSSWVPGARFRASVVHDASNEARIAERQGVASGWTVTTSGFSLGYHDVFKRESDGKTFRVTGAEKDGETASVATFSFTRLPAEAWEVPHD